MIVKWYHFALLVTLAIANPLPLGNPAEEQFLKKYFNSGFEFHSDEEKSFRTVSNYAKVRLKINSNFFMESHNKKTFLVLRCEVF